MPYDLAVPRRSATGSRARGSIEELPSGALRERVYAGIDPVTGRRHYLSEMVKAGPKAAREAEAVRNRLLSQVAEKRNPWTSATVDQLLTRDLDQFDGAPNTLTLYRGYVRNHISPFLGQLTVGALDADVLDSFYAELRRCRKHCTGRRRMDHHTAGSHDCDRPVGLHHAGRIVTIEIGETVLRVYDERGDHLINQIPRTSTKPLARFKAYGDHRNRTTG